jgi:hypothetical protein
MTIQPAEYTARGGVATNRAGFISQSTAVEQARAVAEVHAAVTVAQQIPRDLNRAVAEMRDACGRMPLAQRAFYSVPNRGNGPSVHLARELACIWGNIDYGVHELRRDDEAGESEVRAFAWDQERNTRSTRTFIVPHARMKGGKRLPLTDLGDIYLSNQNVGARAVRECIFTVLPTWYTDEAMTLCRRTLEDGEGEPLPERIDKMIAAFAAIDVGIGQLEAKLGRKRGAWNAGDVAQMAITYTSITRDGLSKDDEFPAERVTAADITGPPADASAAAMTDKQRRTIFALFGDLGLDGDEHRDTQLDHMQRALGRRPASRGELSSAEAATVIDHLSGLVAEAFPPAEGEPS